MKTITIFLWCLVGLVLGTVVALGQNPTPIANLQRATTVYTTNIIPVVTNPGQTNGTKGIELDDFLASLVGFPGWPSVSVPNAIGTVKTNGATLTASATSINFVQGSNTVLRATNSAGAVSIEINAAASGSASVNTNLQLQSLKVWGDQTNVGSLFLGTNFYLTDFGANNFALVDAQRSSSVLYFSSAGSISLGTPSNTSFNVYPPTTFSSTLVGNKTNIFVGDVRLPSIATNRYLFIDGNSNVVGLASGGGGGGGGSDIYLSTNGTQIGYGTNFNFVNGFTGFVSGATVTIGQNHGWENAISNLVATKQHGTAILTNLSGTGAITNLNWSLIASVTNVNGISNYVGSVSNLVQTKQHGTAILTNISGTGAITNLNWSVIASITNVNGVSNYVGSVSNALWAGDNSVSNYVGSISNLSQTKQLGSANLTNWSNIPTGAMANVASTTFLTNWANAISNMVGSSTGTNFNGTITTNLSRFVVTHYGDSTNIVVPVNSTNTADWYPASNAAITLSGSFVADQAQTLFITIALTNESITSIVLPVADANGQPIVLKNPPSTNLLAIRWDGTRMFGESGLSGFNTNQIGSDGSSIKSGAALTNAIIHSLGFIPPIQPYGSTNWLLVFDEEFTHDTADTAGLVGREYWLRSASGAVGVPQRPGLMAFGTHDIVVTNAGHRQSIYAAAYTDTAPSGLYLTNCEWKAIFRFQTSATNDATDVMGYRIGLHDALSSEATQGAYMLLTNNVFSLATANTTRTFNTGLGSNLVANSWFVCGLHGDATGTNVVMWLGGNENAMTPVATNSASLPTAVVSPAIYFHKYAGATTRVTNTVDYFKVWYRRLSP